MDKANAFKANIFRGEHSPIDETEGIPLIMLSDRQLERLGTSSESLRTISERLFLLLFKLVSPAWLLWSIRKFGFHFLSDTFCTLFGYGPEFQNFFSQTTSKDCRLRFSRLDLGPLHYNKSKASCLSLREVWIYIWEVMSTE